MDRKKWKIIAIVIAFIIACSVVGYLLYEAYFTKEKSEIVKRREKTQKSQDKTNKLQTYKSEEQGFSITYPEGWESKEEKYKDESFITFSDSSDESKNILVKVSQESLENELEKGSFFAPLRNYKEEEINIDNRKAYRVSAEYLIESTGEGDEYDEEMISTFIANGNSVYVISGYSSLEEIYENSLYSIRFY